MKYGCVSYVRIYSFVNIICIDRNTIVRDDIVGGCVFKSLISPEFEELEGLVPCLHIKKS